MTKGQPEQKDRAIVLSIVGYGESDLIVRLLCEDLGRVGAFARGAKKSQKRFSGLTPLAGGTVTFATRKRGDLVELKRATMTYDLDAFGADPARMGRAQYLLELTERLLPEREPAPELFDDLVRALGALAAGADYRVLRAYELRLLWRTGYLPDLDGDEDVAAYDPAARRLLPVPVAGSLPFSSAARDAAQVALEENLLALSPMDRDVAQQLARVFKAHLDALGIGPLKTVAFLKSLAQYAGRG